MAAPSTEGGESVSGYFRKLFEENPSWLQGRTNEEVLGRWLADNPDHQEVPRNIKASLSNLKSVLRSKKRKKGRRKQEIASVAASHEAVATAPTRQRKTGDHDTLEELIDDCLTLAKTLDREGLHSVIQLLRRARNEVVWKTGH